MTRIRTPDLPHARRTPLPSVLPAAAANKKYMIDRLIDVKLFNMYVPFRISFSKTRHYCPWRCKAPSTFLVLSAIEREWAIFVPRLLMTFTWTSVCTVLSERSPRLFTSDDKPGEICQTIWYWFYYIQTHWPKLSHDDERLWHQLEVLAPNVKHEI